MFRKITMQEISRRRQVLYGFAALWILLFHMQSPIPDGAIYAPVAWLQKNGSCGVDIFVLLTGMGLYASWKREPVFRAYYGRRLVRVALPGVIVTAIHYGLHEGSLLGYLSKLTLVSYWLGEAALWYVPFILVLYAVYPAVYALQQRRPRALWLLMALAAAAAVAAPYAAPGPAAHLKPAIERIPVFLLGCILAPRVERDRAVPHWALAALAAAYAALIALHNAFGPLNYIFVSMSYIFLSSFVVLALTLMARWAAKIAPGRIALQMLAFYGAVSLEVYLLFSRIRDLLMRCGAYASGGMSLIKLEVLAIILTTLLSVALNRLCRVLREYWTDAGRRIGEM